MITTVPRVLGFLLVSLALSLVPAACATVAVSPVATQGVTPAVTAVVPPTPPASAVVTPASTGTAAQGTVLVPTVTPVHFPAIGTATASPVGEINNQAVDTEVNETSLAQFIVGSLAETSARPKLVARVSPGSVEGNRPIDVQKAPISQAWRCSGDACEAIGPDVFRSSLAGEKTSPWNNTYLLFSIMSAAGDGSSLVIRLDQYSGPKAGSGRTVVLQKVDGTFKVISSSPVWTS